MIGAKGKPWFAVKQYGYGVGLPIAWEGWLVSAGYLAAAGCSAMLLSPLTSVIVLIFSTAAILYIARVRSNDDWRWRSGD